MNDWERSMYESECERQPWMKEVRMGDEEFRQHFDADLGEGATNRQFRHLYNDHWSWVCLALFKHFYETGEYHHFDNGYLDGQNDYVLYRIMKAHGADRKTIDDVICMKRNFEFES